MKKLAACLLFIGLTAGCVTGEGGSEAGNPPSTASRDVAGSVSTSMASLVFDRKSDRSSPRSSSGCSIDSVIATNTSGQATSATVDAACAFTIPLAVNSAYSFSLVLEDAPVAAMAFSNTSGGVSSPYFYVSAGTDAIYLGQILIQGRRGLPEREPSTQCDRDRDGIDDFSDDDDDNDAIFDDQEEDCDLDGILDDDDPVVSSCQPPPPGGLIGSVTRVDPRNDFDLNSGDDLVDLDREVEARFSCPVDRSTVSSATFTVESSSHVAMTCEFEISDDRIKCRHEAHLFQPNTAYTATVNGVRCLNGNEVRSSSWSWKTDDGQ